MHVINLFGGPGSGKSTLMAGIFYHMKNLRYNVEMAPEVVKPYVYSGDHSIFEDQGLILAKQEALLRGMDGKVDFVITDSPLLMSNIYGSTSKFFKIHVENRFDRYQNHNILITRSESLPYQQEGRFQTEEEAKEFDAKNEKALWGYNYTKVPRDLVLSFVLSLVKRLSQEKGTDTYAVE